MAETQAEYKARRAKAAKKGKITRAKIASTVKGAVTGAYKSATKGYQSNTKSFIAAGRAASGGSTTSGAHRAGQKKTKKTKKSNWQKKAADYAKGYKAYRK